MLRPYIQHKLIYQNLNKLTQMQLKQNLNFITLSGLYTD